MHAAIEVTGRGLLGRVLGQAADALLVSGALRLALDRIASEFVPAPALAC